MPVTGDDASAHHKQTTLMSDEIQSPIVRFGLSLGVLLCFLSVPVSGYFLTQIVIQARGSHDWPSVEGQLLRAQVGGNGAHGFHADVSYRYEVNGQIYNGQRVRTSDGEYKIRDGAKQAIRGLIAGQRITVYYDPHDPSESVLEPGAGYQEYTLLGVPVILLVMGAGLLIRLRRTQPSR